MRAVPKTFPQARIEIVGLGIGTLGCAGRPGQSWRFYEIDPKVVEIARDATRFRFLARCQSKAPVIVGDARLMLERSESNGADVLVLDAFTSDSVPMHLLTKEAFEVYARHLSANGLLMVHISNRYLNLRPVVASVAARGWIARQRAYEPTLAEKKEHAAPSLWIMLSRSPETIAAVERESGSEKWEPLPLSPSTNWTDDHASIMPVLRF